MTRDLPNYSLIFWEVMTFIVLLAMFLLVLYAIRLLRKRLREPSGNADRGHTAPEVLDRRYASGEITQEEYLTIRDDITRKQNA
ncbi:hypothetical protein BH24ACT22_BH24ACT22_19050 [soil metagenome]